MSTESLNILADACAVHSVSRFSLNKGSEVRTNVINNPFILTGDSYGSFIDGRYSLNATPEEQAQMFNVFLENVRRGGKIYSTE